MNSTRPDTSQPVASRGLIVAAILQGILWTALYTAGIWYSDVFIVGPSHVTLFWPAAGVAFALVVRRGMRWSAIIPVAVLIAHLTFARVPLSFIPFSVASNLVGAFAGVLVCRAIRFRHFDSATGVFAFLSGAGAMAVVSASVGTAGLLISGMVPPHVALNAYIKWALGDFLGILCIAPTLLLVTLRVTDDVDTPLAGDYAQPGEKSVWVLGYAASYAFVYWVGLQNSSYALGMVAVPLALLLWSAYRFQRLWTAIGALTSVFLVTSLTGLGLAAFQAPRTLLDVILLLGFLSIFAALPLLLMASIHGQRAGAQRTLRLAAEHANKQHGVLERMVAERTRQLDDVNRQLEDASQTDALTGLRNRRYIARQLPLDLGFYAREAKEARRPPHALFFALVDIDHFKRINDSLGHRAGDEVLQQFGSVLTGLVRGSDYAIRWGGEEFLLVLRPMPNDQVATLGNRICHHVAAHPFRTAEGVPVNVTCSVGFAELDLVEQRAPVNWEQIVEVADAALYWVKNNGRDGWALLCPAADSDLATLASASSREGAQALIDKGKATLQASRKTNEPPVAADGE